VTLVRDTHLRGVSLDLGRQSTGVVEWMGNIPMTTGIIHLPAGGIGLQLFEFEKSLIPMLDTGVTWVAYENASVANFRHASIQLAMVGLVEMRCHQRSLLCYGAHSATMKKRLAGSGRAKKPDMVRAAQALWPHLNVTDHNIADALAAGLVLLDKAEVEQ